MNHLLTTLLLLPLLSHGQKPAAKPHRWQMAWVGVYGGSTLDIQLPQVKRFTVSDYGKLSGIDTLQPALGAFSRQVEETSLLDASVGLKKKSTPNSGLFNLSWLQLGISFTKFTLYTSNFGFKVLIADTLLDSTSGKLYRVDSTASIFEQFSYTNNQIQVRLSIGIDLIQKKRYRIYQGFGILAGVQRQGEFSYMMTNYYQIRHRYFPISSSNNQLFTAIVREDLLQKQLYGSSSLSFYLQSGVGYQLHKRLPLHLTAEARPGAEILFVKGLRTYTRITLPICVGIRYSFKQKTSIAP